MNIYDKNGYINISEIASQGAWLNVLISARQRFGKTYGVLKYMLDNDLNHILLRRSTQELEAITASDLLNPYKSFEPYYHVGFFRAGEMANICDYHIENNKPIAEKKRGLLMSLPQVAHVRGFNGSMFSDLIFDEFIPEKGAYQRKTEDDALLNAYVTINGNREDNGKPPLRLWLLANSNNINSPILEAFNLTDIVIEIQRKKQEYYLKDNVCVVIPRGNAKADKRKETALNKQIRKDSAFYRMANNNEFAYDLNPLIKTYGTKGMTPLFSYDNTLYAWENDDIVYINRAKHKVESYDFSEWSREQLRINYLWLKRAYLNELVYFSDLRLLALFKRLFDIDY